MAQPIVHFELSAHDPRAAGEWYNKLFGWPVTVEERWDYVMVTTQERFGGGFNPVGPEMPAGTSIVYIAVDDFDSSVQRIEAAGGTVVMARQDLPGVGAIGTFKDPTGNVVGLLQPDMSAMENAPPPALRAWPHPIAHVELSANDPRTAGEWYEKLFGWAPTYHAAYNYVTFTTDGQFGGGFSDVSQGLPAGTTVIYVHTDDIGATVAQMRDAGGVVMLEPTAMPGAGVIGMVQDPTGNVVGLLQPEMPVAEVQPAGGQAQAA